jgi:hypothetical protein
MQERKLQRHRHVWQVLSVLFRINASGTEPKLVRGNELVVRIWRGNSHEGAASSRLAAASSTGSHLGLSSWTPTTEGAAAIDSRHRSSGHGLGLGADGGPRSPREHISDITTVRPMRRKTAVIKSTPAGFKGHDTSAALNTASKARLARHDEAIRHANQRLSQPRAVAAGESGLRLVLGSSDEFDEAPPPSSALETIHVGLTSHRGRTDTSTSAAKEDGLHPSNESPLRVNSEPDMMATTSFVSPNAALVARSDERTRVESRPLQEPEADARLQSAGADQELAGSLSNQGDSHVNEMVVEQTSVTAQRTDLSQAGEAPTLSRPHGDEERRSTVLLTPAHVVGRGPTNMAFSCYSPISCGWGRS